MAARRLLLPSSARPATLADAAHAGADYGVSDRPDWRTVPWRSRLRAVTVDGRRVHVVDAGRGMDTPLVLIHGLGGRWQSWLETIPRIASQRRVVALDLPGFGRSQPPREAISIPRYAQTVERVCDLLGLDRVIVVGNSMGGFVAAELALRFPARVERLVLVSAAAVSIGDFNPLPAMLLVGALARTPLGSAEGMRALIARRRARHLAFANLVRHPTLIDTAMLSELVGGRGAPGLRDAARAMMAHDIRGQLPRLDAPTLIVHGR
jgi:pimeloyl-ACP methyl ester carboxylesterase